MLVAKGNPKHISGPSSMCGDTLSTVLGSVESQRIAGWSSACTAAGKAAIRTVSEPTITSALEALLNRQVDGLLYEIDFLGNEVKMHPTDFQVVGPEYGDAPSAIAMPKTDTALEHAIIQVIEKMEHNGTWQKLLESFGFSTKELANPADTTLPYHS
jgi:polar amino acid transport system substrate-binding protein